ncbi:MAG: restriction endonuclease subunit S [Patescibacteria group bacterium]
MSKLLEKINTSNKRTGALSSFIDLVGGGTPKTTVKEYWNGDVPWLSVVDFNNDFRWVSNAEKKITQVGVENSSTRVLDKGDIIISARGTVGALAQLSRPMAFNQSCYGIRAKRDMDQSYLYYLLKSSIPKLTQIVHGAVFDTITKDSFEHVSVSVPDISTQKRIAEILNVYDEKIENNHKIIKNLETVAQALFDEWFINFRFPGWEKIRMVDSDLGKIPQGWEVSSLGNISKNHDNKRIPLSSMQRNKRRGKIPYYGANGVLDYVDKSIFSGEYILFAEDGSVKTRKNTPVIHLVDGDFWVNNHAHIISGDKVSNYFLYLSIRNINIDSYITGGVQPKITQQNLNSILIIVPEETVLIKFELMVNSMKKRIKVLDKEKKNLAKMRERLLVKLI